MAVLTEDHPLEYTEFEGVIPEGNYGAGAMIIWDRGTWQPIPEPGATFEEGKLLFELHGHKLRGVWTLVRTKGGEGRQWLLIKKPDAAAQEGEPSFDETSILSGLTVEALTDRDQKETRIQDRLLTLGTARHVVDPTQIELMLAKPCAEPFDDPRWLFELKYDGYRLLASRQEDHVGLRLRNGGDATSAFPEVTRTLRALPFKRFVLDGEVVVLDDDGKPNFSRLARRAKLVNRHDLARSALEHPATFYAFDVLGFGDWDVRGLPLTERKKILRDLVPATGPVRYTDHVEGAGVALYAAVTRAGAEGIVAKRAASTYGRGRSEAWLKIRREQTGDFVIVGYTKPSGSRAGVGALHIAAHRGSDLVYAGRVGAGLSDRVLVEMREELERLARHSPPCTGARIPRRRQDVWVEPTVVCEVRYKELTEDHLLRMPVFVRRRTDKRPTECRLDERTLRPEERLPAEIPAPDEGSGRTISFTNLDKVFWPSEGYTKGDLIRYYRTVGRWILPYLEDRLLVLTRYPDGIEGKSFFQRNAPPYAPDWIRRETRWNEDEGRDIEYPICDRIEVLEYLANLGTIPLHIWSSRIDSLQNPDWCVLDLDPKTAPFSHVVELAHAVHDLCEEIGLPSFAKTSGSTGLHVLLPLGRQMTHAQSRSLGQIMAQVIADQRPDIATVDRAMTKRKGRVYIDWGQNGQGRVLASPYCVRPVPGAKVSTPLAWAEMTEHLDDGAFTIASVPDRLLNLGEDPMLPLFGLAPDLPRILERLSQRL